MKSSKFALCLAVVCATNAAAQEDRGDPEAGRAIAVDVCSYCHAIGPEEDFSPVHEATPFRVVARTPGMNEMAFIAWMTTSHPTMPNIMLEGEQLKDVASYILNLKDHN